MTSTPSRPASSAGPETLPVLPLRDIVVFPYMIVPLFVGREKSIRALEDVMREEKRILLVAQKNPADDDPPADAIYEVGTLAQVLQLLKLPDRSEERRVGKECKSRWSPEREKKKREEWYSDTH